MATAAVRSNRVNRSRRLRKRADEPTRIARLLLPAEQANRGDFRAVDVSNHSDADQRHMVRSGEKRTIRRKTHIEKIQARLELDPREAAACQWYADAHAARYDTLGLTAAYGDQGRSSKLNFDHLPNTAEQDEAGSQFRYAREGISPPLRLMFDRVVIHGWEVNPSIATLFRFAARQLMYRIEGFAGLCD